MFMDELSPILKELTQQPVAFLGGLVSGLLRLNLNDDPVKTWLNEQTGSSSYTSPASETSNGKNSGPQSITID
ncbi:MAG: hypothetical protein ACM37W_07815 [Actinomycetota bacterium]